MQRAATLLLVLGLLAVGISARVQAQIIDPNIGFCTAPASASACQGQPETNPTASGGAGGMWAFGSYDTSNPWYLVSAIPNGTYTSGTAPTLTSSSFDSESATPPSFPTTGSSTPENLIPSSANDIYLYLGSDNDDWRCPRHPRPPVCGDAVPEPASLIMMSSGLILLAGMLRRRLFALCVHVNNPSGQ